MQTILRATGFSCPSCVATIERQVGRLPGVQDVTVHFATGRVVVEHDDVPDEALVAAVREAGYTSTVRR